MLVHPVSKDKFSKYIYRLIPHSKYKVKNTQYIIS